MRAEIIYLEMPHPWVGFFNNQFFLLTELDYLDLAMAEGVT